MGRRQIYNSHPMLSVWALSGLPKLR